MHAYTHTLHFPEPHRIPSRQRTILTANCIHAIYCSLQFCTCCMSSDWDRLSVPVHKPRTWQCYIGAESTGSKQTGQRHTGAESTGRKQTGQRHTGAESTGSKQTGPLYAGAVSTGSKPYGHTHACPLAMMRLKSSQHWSHITFRTQLQQKGTVGVTPSCPLPQFFVG